LLNLLTLVGVAGVSEPVLLNRAAPAEAVSD